MQNKTLQGILNKRKMRVALTRQSHEWFFSIYFSHYIECKSAPFHKEFFRITEDEKSKMAVIISFRGSAKSSIITTSFPLWAITGKLQKKFVILVGRTQRQARQILENVKRELENNKLLINDLGPFKQQENDLGTYSLYLPWYDAQIMAVSMEQSIRGIRHGKNRPDLIIADDIETLENIESIDNRNKVYNWVVGEILPIGQANTKVIFVGNLLHEDALLPRLKKKIQANELDADLLEVPLVDCNGNIAWPGMYPNDVAIEKKRKEIVDNIAWHREYLLLIVPDKRRIILQDWIRTYNDLPNQTEGNDFKYAITSVDPAFSDSDTAAKTAVLSALVFGSGKNLKIYILSNYINERLTGMEILNRVKDRSLILGNGDRTRIIIEDVAAQKTLIQNFEYENYPVKGIKVAGSSKRDRLQDISFAVENGTVMFPQTSVNELINQLVNFDVSRFHDLADAFSMLIREILRIDAEEEYETSIRTENFNKDEFYTSGYGDRGWDADEIEAMNRPAIEISTKGIRHVGGDRSFL